jgi:hypothetical protein
MRSFALAVTLGLIAVVALSSAVLAGNQRPFKASFSGSGIEVAQRCGPNALTIGFNLSGVATHMGRLTGVGSNCTEFTLLTEAVDIWDGIVVLTAADGSSLTLSGVGSQGTPSGGWAAIAQTLSVESGTGRFADADGVVDLIGIVDFSQIANGIVTTSGTVSGWLSY